jgi:type IV secretory pathway VirB10-like protein
MTTSNPSTLKTNGSLRATPIPIRKKSFWPLIWLGIILAAGIILTVLVLVIQHALSARADTSTSAFAVSTSAPAGANDNPTDRSWFYGHDTCLATGCGTPIPRATTAASPAAASRGTPVPDPYAPQQGGNSNGMDVGSVLMNPNALVNAGGQHQNAMDAQYDDSSAATPTGSETYSGPTPGVGASSPPTIAPVVANGQSGTTGVESSQQQSWRSKSSVENPSCPIVLQAGVSYIEATMDQEVNSRKAGNPVALFSRDRLDSVTLSKNVGPRGTRAYGEFHEAVVYGQNWLAVVWKRLVFPNGKTYTLEDFPSADSSGAAGVNAYVDKHTGNIVGNGLLLSLFGMLPVLASNGACANGSYNASVGCAFAQSNVQTMTNLQNALIGPAIAQPPTLRVPIGTPILIGVTRDMCFPSAYPFDSLTEAP